MKKDYKAIAMEHADTLHRAAVENGITQSDIAKKTGTAHSNVNRSLTGKYVMRLDLFLKYCDAVGLKMTLTNIKNPK